MIRLLTSSDDFEPDFFNNRDEDYQPNAENTIKSNVEEPPAPIDKYNIVYILCFFLGTIILFPWFFFVTCSDYWMYRFRDLTPKVYFVLDDGIFVKDASNRTALQADFTSYASIASTLPSTAFLFFNMFFFNKTSTHWRIVCSLFVVLIFFTETTVLVFFNSDSWQKLFFIITIITVVILNMAISMLQAALCGIFMKFPIIYVSAFSSGQSVAGIIAAAAQICTLLIDSSPEISTFVYFLFGDITMLASLFGYLYIRKVEFYRFYANDIRKEFSGSIQYQRLETNPSIPFLHISYSAVQNKIWIPSIGIFLTNLVTSSVFPAIAVLVCSVNTGVKSLWNDEYFVPVVTYLTYSMCEYTGRMLVGYVQKPKGKLLIWFSFARIVFIPLLMLCNAEPRYHLPVLIDSDLIYTFLVIVFAFSNGYISTLTFVLSSEYAYPHEQEVASIILVTWLAASISLGSLLSFALVNLL